MSLIEDLKKQARASKQGSPEAEDISDKKESLFGPIIRPRLRLAQSFFTELSDTINQLERDSRVDFRLTNTVTLKGLRQENFACFIEKNQQQEINEVHFKHELNGQNDFNVTCRSAAEAELLKKVLTDRAIRYQSKTEGNGNFTFKIRQKISCRISFLPDFESGQITLKITNYDGTWDQKLNFRPDKVNDELLDEIGKYAMHEDNQLMEMTGNRLSITMRERLQEKLKIPRRKKVIRKKKVKKKKLRILGILKK